MRTPLFKKYFGDWETAAMSEFYENGVSYEEVKTRLLSFLENGKPTLLYNSNTADSINFSKSSIGKLLSEGAVRKSVTNGFSRKQHYAVVSDIKRLFYDSIKLIERPDKNNDPNVKIIRFGRPVIIGGKTRLVFITVKESTQHGERLYSAELIELKKLEGNLEEVDATHFPTSSKEKLKEFFNSVKPSDVSVVRDTETGEPLTVYHSGTFDPYSDIVKEGMHFGSIEAARQRAFTSGVDHAVKDMLVKQDANGWYWDSEEVPPLDGDARYPTEAEARKAGAAEITEELEAEGIFNIPDIEDDDFTAVFLNIRNPLYAEDAGGDWESVIKKAKAGGKDGVIYENRYEDPGSTGFIAIAPETVKSATDNAGTFDTGYKSILYSRLTGAAPDPAPLFQLIEADADEAVEKYDSPEAWMEADRKAMEAEEGGEFPAAEG